MVFKCINRQSGQVVAIKRYSENDSDPIIRKIAMREVKMLRQLKHPNLINLIEVFRRKRRLHLVFDYCELTVLDVIEKYTNNCPLNLIKKIIWQTVNGINYCHGHNCIHRDIKPENILINQSGIVKLCDFGFARNIVSTSANHESLAHKQKSIATGKENDFLERQALTEYVATRWYRAPELLIGEIYYDIKIDIWAIGCVTAELMKGEPIWPGKTDIDQLCIIKSSLGQLTASQQHTLLNQSIYDQMTIEKILMQTANMNESLDRKLPTSRIGQSGLEFVTSCLQMDHSKRPTSEELLKHPYIYSSRMSQFMMQNNSIGQQHRVADTNIGNNIDGRRNNSMTNSQSLMLLASSKTTPNKRLVVATSNSNVSVAILQKSKNDNRGPKNPHNSPVKLISQHHKSLVSVPKNEINRHKVTIDSGLQVKKVSKGKRQVSSTLSKKSTSIHDIENANSPENDQSCKQLATMAGKQRIDSSTTSSTTYSDSRKSFLPSVGEQK